MGAKASKKDVSRSSSYQEFTSAEMEDILDSYYHPPEPDPEQDQKDEPYYFPFDRVLGVLINFGKYLDSFDGKMCYDDLYKTFRKLLYSFTHSDGTVVLDAIVNGSVLPTINIPMTVMFFPYPNPKTDKNARQIIRQHEHQETFSILANHWVREGLAPNFPLVYNVFSCPDGLPEISVNPKTPGKPVQPIPKSAKGVYMVSELSDGMLNVYLRNVHDSLDIYTAASAIGQIFAALCVLASQRVCMNGLYAKNIAFSNVADKTAFCYKFPNSESPTNPVKLFVRSKGHLYKVVDFARATHLIHETDARQKERAHYEDYIHGAMWDPNDLQGHSYDPKTDIRDYWNVPPYARDLITFLTSMKSCHSALGLWIERVLKDLFKQLSGFEDFSMVPIFISNVTSREYIQNHNRLTRSSAMPTELFRVTEKQPVVIHFPLEEEQEESDETQFGEP